MRKILFSLFLLFSLSSVAQKSVAIFGGSVAQYFNDLGVQPYLEKAANVEIHNFAVSGEGLCKQTTTVNGEVVVGGIAKQVDNQCQKDKPQYDLYVIWCSTNDIWGNPIGKPSDYTSEDGYDRSKLYTQDGGLNYCIRTIQEFAPKAKICVLASLKSFKSSYGFSKTGEQNYTPKRRMWDYVQGQIECAERHSLPVLNLWSVSGINEYNYKTLCPDGIHPTEQGYLRLCPMLKSFITSIIE